MLYKQIIRLFSRDTAFRLMLMYLRTVRKIPFSHFFIKLFHPVYASLSSNLLDLRFSGPIGLGPGLDKNGLLIEPITDFGFSFVTVGPVNANTVREAISNIRVNTDKTNVTLCINRDYSTAFFLAYDFVDAFLLDIPDSDITEVLEQILDLRLTYDTYKPVFLRITHDMTDAMLHEILDFSLRNGVDGFEVAKVDNVRRVNEFACKRALVIGYGGVRTAEDVNNMLDAGASLVSITTGLVLDGPGIASRILKNLANGQQKKN